MSTTVFEGANLTTTDDKGVTKNVGGRYVQKYGAVPVEQQSLEARLEGVIARFGWKAVAEALQEMVTARTAELGKP